MYLTLTNHKYNPQSVVISKRFRDSLFADEKKIVQDAALESAKYQREQSRAAAATILDSLKKSGMQVTELPPAEGAPSATGSLAARCASACASTTSKHPSNAVRRCL